MVTIPIHQSRSEEIGDALLEHMVSRYSIQDCSAYMGWFLE